MYKTIKITSPINNKTISAIILYNIRINNSISILICTDKTSLFSVIKYGRLIMFGDIISDECIILV